MENNNKIVKKNKKPLIIVAMVLMVALVVGMGAMTYSKYISTTDVPAQTATAAQWGFVVTANADNLFDTVYATDGGDTVVTTTESGSVVVQAASTGKIVAPGTSGSMTITVNGKAEVNAELSIESESAITEIHYGDYYPLKWTLNETEYDTFDALVTEIQNNNKVYAAGTSINLNYTIGWTWEFEQGADAAAKAENNKKDTVIGLVSSWRALSASEQAATPINVYVNRGLGLPDDDTTYSVATLEAISTTISFDIIINVEQTQEAATP